MKSKREQLEKGPWVVPGVSNAPEGDGGTTPPIAREPQRTPEILAGLSLRVQDHQAIAEPWGFELEQWFPPGCVPESE